MEVTVKIRTSAGMTETAINCDRDRFYQIAAELMTQNPTDKAEYTYITPDGIVSYLSRPRSGTQFITEKENTLPMSRTAPLVKTRMIMLVKTMWFTSKIAGLGVKNIRI